MSTDVQWEGGFSGKKRQEVIHMRLFNLLSDFGNPNDEGIVFDWMTDELGWGMVTMNEECLFASLARALPDANFDYETSFDYEGGGLDQMFHSIQYENGTLSLSSVHRYENEEEYDWEDDEDHLDEDDQVSDNKKDWWYEEDHASEDEESLSCKIDKEGNIVGDEKLLQKCIKSEKEKLSKVLRFIGSEVEDPTQLINLGILYETGLAGVNKDLKIAWNYYLRAVGMGDQKAIKFVREIFSAENKEDFHKLIKDRCINIDSFPIFLDLAIKENNTEVIAILLEYKNYQEKNL